MEMCEVLIITIDKLLKKKMPMKLEQLVQTKSMMLVYILILTYFEENVRKKSSTKQRIEKRIVQTIIANKEYGVRLHV